MLVTESLLINELPENLRPPVHCPHCQSALVMQDAWPLCPNFSCPMRIYGRIQKFVDVLDIKQVGEGAIFQMVQRGWVKTPADLYSITEAQFSSLDRKGEKHYVKFTTGLQVTRSMSTAQFFAALDIEGIGSWDNICAVKGLQTVDEIIAAAKDPGKKELFTRAIRISLDKADSICREIIQRSEEITALKAVVSFKQPGTSMIGKVICITGSLATATRPKIEQMVKDAGGQVSSDISSRTTHLVTNDKNSGSSKNKKAAARNIPVISEQELLSMMS